MKAVTVVAAVRSKPAGWRRLLRSAATALLAVTAAVAGCGSGTADRDRLSGAHLVVLADWKRVEQQRFAAVLHAFEQGTGATVSYVAPGDGVPEQLAAMIRSNQTPDIAVLPQPALLQQYAAAGKLVPLAAETAALVDQNFAPVWRRLGSFDGKLYGVWFKAADKSLVWYSVRAFERAGVVPPTTLQGLLSVAETLKRAGIAPFAVGAHDGWTLTDLFENVYLRTAGTRRYDALTAHQLPWTDPSVISALQLCQRLLAPGFLAGGIGTALATDFPGAVGKIEGRPPSAAMLVEADFVAGNLHDTVRTGTDVDAFPFPAFLPPQPVVVAGGDVAVQFHRSAAAAAFMRYLATPDAASLWAAKGGFISPNTALDLSVYPDAMSRSFARNLLEAGDDVRFDLSDQQPGGFGSSETAGMAPALRALIRGTDVRAVARELEAGASLAFRGSSS